MSLFTRTARAPLEYSKSLWMRGWVIMVMLFLYIPARVQYLMPAMLGFAALCAVWRVQRVALLGLALAQFSYWFVSIDLLQIDPAPLAPAF